MNNNNDRIGQYRELFFNKALLAKYINPSKLHIVPDPNTPLTPSQRILHLKRIIHLIMVHPLKNASSSDPPPNPCQRCDILNEASELYAYLGDRIKEEQYYKRFNRLPVITRDDLN